MNQKNHSADNIPLLRFPEFVREWERKKLGEVAEFLDGRRRPLKQGDRALIKGKYPYYGASGIIDYVNDFIFDEEIILLGEDGENIISRNSPLAFKVSGKCWVNNHAHVLKPFIEYEINFVTQLLERVSYIQYNTGTAQPKLNQEICRKIPLIIPTLPEQTRIANFLTAVDEKIQVLKKKKGLLEAYKKGVMQKLFSQELRFKGDDGQAFADWKVKKLGEVFSFKVTNSFSRENLNYENGEVKNIHYGDIHTKFQTLFIIKNEVVPFVNQEISIQRIAEDNYCKEGDMIFADASEDLNDVGKSIEIVNLNNEKILSGLHTILARPSEGTFSIGFAGYLSKSNSIRIQIQKEAQGSKVLSISAGRLSGISISFPCLEEQSLIANFLSAIDDKIKHNAVQIQKMEVWKKGLLQKMFV